MLEASEKTTYQGLGELSFFNPWKRFFRSLLGPLPRDVLDVGCGAGDLVFLFHSLGHTSCGVDFDETHIERSRRIARSRFFAVDFRHGTPDGFPFPARSFDAVHVRLDRFTQTIAREAFRVLRPGGVLVLAKLAEPCRTERAGPLWRACFGRAAGFIRLPFSLSGPACDDSFFLMEEAVERLRSMGLAGVKSSDLSPRTSGPGPRRGFFSRLARSRPPGHFAVWGFRA
jgi:SAM-dependent methyltransferase